MALSKMQLQRRDKIIRRQPFGIIISGDPGCGKSFAAMSLSTRLYEAFHGKPSSDELIVLNEGDAFQSEFRTTHKIVIFDDLGATRVTTVPSDPFRKVIDFINNIPRTALNPNVELKGSVWIEPEIVVATTNMDVPFIRDQQRNTDSIFCVGAINRRFPLTIYQSGYDEFSLVPPVGEGNRADNRSHNRDLPKMGFEQLYVEAYIRYANHLEAQDSFVDLVERDLPIERSVKSESFQIQPSLSLMTPKQRYLRCYFSDKLFHIWYPYLQDGQWCPTSHGFIAKDGAKLMSPEHYGTYQNVSELPFYYTYEELLDESIRLNPPSLAVLRAESLILPGPDGDDTDTDHDSDIVIPPRFYLVESEQDQINRFLRVFPFPSSVLSNTYQHVSICSITGLGEIDLLMRVSNYSFMVVECKRSSEKKTLNGSVKQARKYATMIAHLRPTARVFGVCYSYKSIRVVFDSCKAVEPQGFSDFFELINYDHSLRFGADASLAFVRDHSY